MTRADRLTLVRQHRAEGLSQRAIAKRLRVSKDTVRRDFERLDAEGEPGGAPSGEPDETDAPQVSGVLPEESAPGDEPEGAPRDEPDEVADTEPVRPVLRIDLTRRRRLLANLTRLVGLGLKGPEVIDMSVAAFEAAYRRAVDLGEVRLGEPVEVVAHVRPAPARRAG